MYQQTEVLKLLKLHIMSRSHLYIDIYLYIINM